MQWIHAQRIGVPRAGDAEWILPHARRIAQIARVVPAIYSPKTTSTELIKSLRYGRLERGQLFFDYEPDAD
jgi:hypothetical protein